MSPHPAPRWITRCLAALLLALPVSAAAAPRADDNADAYGSIVALASTDARARRAAADRLLARGDRSLLAPLVDQLFFTPAKLRDEIQRVLVGLSGEPPKARYLDWVEFLGAHPELVPPSGYLTWKGQRFARIHPRFATLLRDGLPLHINPAEIVFGGVPFDGIPSLERPPHVAAAQSDLPAAALVFAARLGGEARAWPLDVLSWHEMLNDRLGGEPVTLSFCTLCRSAVLYRGRLPGGEETTFGTSGLLYRSNKLMFDRKTLTLWSNLTGEPVLGPLAATPRALEPLPMTLTSWGAWRRQHPDSTVMIVDPALGRRYGFDYRPGAADARRAGVSFPVPRRDARLPDREEVFGLRLGGHAKAWALPALLATGVLNDEVGGEPVVLHVEAESGAIRAFRRGAKRFRSAAAAAGGAAGPGELLDEGGARWRVGEEALVPADAAQAPLPRLPGGRSFWFGWYAYYPATALWVGPPPPAS